MKTKYLYWVLAVACLGTAAVSPSAAAAPPAADFEWSAVVNNGDLMPDSVKNFNSYNQPSVSGAGLVVFRARGKGPGEPPHGIYTRDMGQVRNGIVKVVDRTTAVPDPNNLGTTFIEYPSFPRIDALSGLFAFRGNSSPVWRYTLPDGTDTRAGTTGVFTNPGERLITGASKLGAVPGFEFYAVPGLTAAIGFDVFPGAPAPAGQDTIAFKGNFTVDVDGAAVGKTGVFYRELDAANAGGSEPIRLIANSLTTTVPGTRPPLLFGSTAPPSASQRTVVFAGFDNEESPSAGGIYAAQLPDCSTARLRKRAVCNPAASPGLALKTLVAIGQRVPDANGKPTRERFKLLGEGVSFDGHVVAFWGAWGSATKAVGVSCPQEGNRARREFCLLQSPLAAPGLDPAVPANHTGNFVFDVPAQQGFFVVDVLSRQVRMVARTGADFDDFLFWNFSGKVPGVGTDGDEDAEPARWRSSAFAAVDGFRAAWRVAFKARKADGATGIYLTPGKVRGDEQIVAVIESGMDGGAFDPFAAGMPVTEMGIERDGFRNRWLAINASMGNEETGWAGIYLTRVR